MMEYPSPIIEIETAGMPGRPAVSIPRDEAFRVRKIFEENEYAVPPQYLPSKDLVIADIGANVGLFALYMHTLRPNSDIYCFEPAPQTLDLLKKNTQEQHRIHIYPYALSDYDGTGKLNLHARNSGENSLKGDPHEVGMTVTVEIRDAGAIFHKIGLSYIDILKIDTEGAEIEILESLHDYLPYTGIIMVEYHSEQDRRAIDALLPNHMLLDAKPCGPNLGGLKYINSRLVEIQQELLGRSY